MTTDRRMMREISSILRVGVDDLSCTYEGDTLIGLDLARKDLTRLPSELSRFSGLQTLDLRLNRLEALPPEIGRLASLQVLNLYDNRLGALPPELYRLPWLEEVNLSDNPDLIAPPPAFYKGSPIAWPVDTAGSD